MDPGAPANSLSERAEQATSIPILVEEVPEKPANVDSDGRPIRLPGAPPSSRHGARSNEERQRRREERARKRKEEAAAEHVQQLEKDVKRLFYGGLFALPLLWLLSLVYFHKEHKDPSASPVIKEYYKKSGIMLCIYTAIFVSWFVVFQVKAESFPSLNILLVQGRSPSGI